MLARTCHVSLWRSVLLCAAAMTGAAVAQPAAPAATNASPALMANSPSGQRIAEQTRQQVIQVRTLLLGQDSQASVGSGFLAAPGGLVLTNYHVVSQVALQPERYRLSYTLQSGASGAVELLAFDVVHDLALVRLIPSAQTPLPAVLPLPFRPAALPLAKGERLHALGKPLDVGFAVAEGVYNGPVERSYLPQMFFGGNLSAGMSGGPAVDEQGRVVGVNVATRRDGQAVSFLVPGERAQALLARALQAGAGATPITGPAHAEVTRQLQAHQVGLVERFLAEPWRASGHARYKVPVPQENFLRCWGSTSQAEERFLRFERSDCVMDSSILVHPLLRTGFLSVRHEIYEGSRLGSARFARVYSESFRNESFFGGVVSTAPLCSEGFVDRNGLALRTVVCLTALKRLPGLFNLSVLATTVDNGTQGAQGRLDAHGVEFPNALRLVEHYLQGFAWTQASPATK
jgi:serine protease Do